MFRLAIAILIGIFLSGCGSDGEPSERQAGESPDNDKPHSSITATPTAFPTVTPTSEANAGRPSATAFAMPTASPLPPIGVLLQGSQTAVSAGQEAPFDLRLRLLRADVRVAGVQNDLDFSSGPLRITAKPNGAPDCTVNPTIDKGSTTFAFRPPGCAGKTCTGVRAIVFSTDNTDPVPDDSPLYTCNVAVAADAVEGTYRIEVTHVVVSDPNGKGIADVNSTAGLFFVHQGPLPTPAPLGNACRFPTDCQSSYCVDETCCASEWCGYGQSCHIFGHEGTCQEPGGVGARCARLTDCRGDLLCLPDGFCDHAPTPTATVTRTPRPTRTATATPYMAHLQVEVFETDSARSTALVGVRLTSDGPVAGVQNHLVLATTSAHFSISQGDQPDCAANPEIDKSGTAFRCLDPDCRRLGAIVFAFDNVDPIANGSVLYTCRIAMIDEPTTVEIAKPISASPQGQRIETNGHGITIDPADDSTSKAAPILH